jgi:hypothetical protein
MIINLLQNKKKVFILTSVSILFISIILKSYGIRTIFINDIINENISNFLHFLIAILMVVSTIILCYYYKLHALSMIIGVQVIIVVIIFILFSLGLIPNELFLIK